jgi:hypothetical protein
MKPLIGHRDHEFNSLKNRAPEWTLNSRLKVDHDLSHTPGPASVNIENMSRFGKVPTFAKSMTSRQKEWSKLTDCLINECA